MFARRPGTDLPLLDEALNRFQHRLSSGFGRFRRFRTIHLHRAWRRALPLVDLPAVLLLDVGCKTDAILVYEFIQQGANTQAQTSCLLRNVPLSIASHGHEAILTLDPLIEFLTGEAGARSTAKKYTEWCQMGHGLAMCGCDVTWAGRRHPDPGNLTPPCQLNNMGATHLAIASSLLPRGKRKEACRQGLGRLKERKRSSRPLRRMAEQRSILGAKSSHPLRLQ
jgi:hypothetical protein